METTDKRQMRQLISQLHQLVGTTGTACVTCRPCIFCICRYLFLQSFHPPAAGLGTQKRSAKDKRSGRRSRSASYRYIKTNWGGTDFKVNIVFQNRTITKVRKAMIVYNMVLLLSTLIKILITYNNKPEGK